METGVVVFASHGRKYIWHGFSCLYTRDELFQSSGLKHHIFLCCFWNTSNNHTKMTTCILFIQPLPNFTYFPLVTSVWRVYSLIGLQKSSIPQGDWIFILFREGLAGVRRASDGECALQVYLCVLVKFTAQERREDSSWSNASCFSLAKIPKLSENTIGSDMGLQRGMFYRVNNWYFPDGRLAFAQRLTFAAQPQGTQKQKLCVLYWIKWGNSFPRSLKKELKIFVFPKTLAKSILFLPAFAASALSTHSFQNPSLGTRTWYGRTLL